VIPKFKKRFEKEPTQKKETLLLSS